MPHISILRDEKVAFNSDYYYYYCGMLLLLLYVGVNNSDFIVPQGCHVFEFNSAAIRPTKALISTWLHVYGVWHFNHRFNLSFR
jgi:hypothetical protein